MKSYREAHREIVEIIADTQRHDFLGGANAYRVDVTPYAQSLAICFRLGVFDVKGGLEKDVEIRFDEMLMEGC